MARKGHIVNTCWQKKRNAENKCGNRKPRKCFNCSKAGHIACSCRKENRESNNDNGDVFDTVMLIILSALVALADRRDAEYWILNSACARNMSKSSSHFNHYKCRTD